jgi:cytosine/adenosine deaminase-related metal-dependent hydrolase
VLERTAGLQRETGVPMRLHCCQSVYEFETVLALRGHTPLGWLETLGLLTERAILPHGIYLSGHPQVSAKGDADMRRLVASGATVAHCPVVFGRDGEALSSFASYMAAGVRFGMGTDTHPADMVENIRLGRMLSRLMTPDCPATAADLYRAATIGGADALGRPDLGRLAPGARADITVFDLSGFHLGQVLDPIKAMALAGTGRDFRASFIDGREVMADFAVAGTDPVMLMQAADRQILKARAIHADRAPGRPAADDIFKAAFPVIN